MTVTCDGRGARRMKLVSRGLFAALLTVALLGCDGADIGVDGGVDGGADDAAVVPTAPAPPSPPAPPQLTCAEGFAAVTLDGNASVCEPWPSSVRPRCAEGARLAAGSGCVPLASDCALDAPPELDLGAAFVRPGSVGGDGSRARPYATILDAVASGAVVIALAPGTHDAPSVLRGRTLAGTCPTLTTVRFSAATTLSDVTLRRLAVTGPGSVLVSSGARASLDRVDVASLGGGIRVEGALEARGTTIRDLPVDAIRTHRASAVLLEDVSIERIRGVALRVDDATPSRTNVTLTRVVIHDIHATVPDAATILLDRAGVLAIDGLVIEDADGHGLIARTTTATVRDIIVRHVGGGALFLGPASEDTPEPLVLSSVWTADTVAGVALGPGLYTVNDLVIERASGLGLGLVGVRGELSRALVDGAAAAGVDVDGGDVLLSDLHVRNVVHVALDDGGALLVEPGAQVRLERARLEHVDHHGIAVNGVTAGASLDASDVEIDTVSAIAVQTGFGVLALDGARVTLTRVSIHDVVTAGVTAQDATVTAVDLAVSHVTTGEGPDGIGVAATTFAEGSAAAVTLERVEIFDVQRWGVIVTGPGAWLSANDLVVRAAHVAPCCEGGRGGGAIVVHDGARATVTRFVVRESEYAGLIVTSGVSASFSQGRVERNPVGLVRSPTLPFNMGADPGLLFSGVVMDDNGVDQQQTETDVQPPQLAL